MEREIDGDFLQGSISLKEFLSKNFSTDTIRTMTRESSAQMNEIRPNLWVGSMYDHEYVDHTFNMIVNCTDEPFTYEYHEDPSPTVVLKLGHVDGHPYKPWVVRMTIRAIADCIEEGGKVFIHCHAGVSRSPSIAGGALLLLGDANNPKEALSVLRKARPCTNPWQKTWDSVMNVAMADI